MTQTNPVLIALPAASKTSLESQHGNLLGRLVRWIKTHIIDPITYFFKAIFCCTHSPIPIVQQESQIPRPIAATTPPPTTSIATLPNVGNSCYINSVIQALARIPAIDQLMPRPLFSSEEPCRSLSWDRLHVIIDKLRNNQAVHEDDILQFLNALRMGQFWIHRNASDSSDFFEALMNAFNIQPFFHLITGPSHMLPIQMLQAAEPSQTLTTILQTAMELNGLTHLESHPDLLILDVQRRSGGPAAPVFQNGQAQLTVNGEQYRLVGALKNPNGHWSSYIFHQGVWTFYDDRLIPVDMQPDDPRLIQEINSHARMLIFEKINA